MPQNTKQENINNSFFDGYYKEIWRHIFPEKTTVAEVDFIINDAQLKSGSYVLDLMCGYGRHSLELAKRGISVTAVDNLPSYIEEINHKASEGNLPVECICTDVLEMKIEKEYDAVICMGNSLQFFNAEDLQKLIENISAHLKPGGRFYINTWTIAEIALQNIKENVSSRIGDMTLQSECSVLFHPTRITVKSTIINDKGDREVKTGIDYIYSIAEMEVLLKKAGLQLKEIYSIPGRKPFTVGEPRAYIVAEKSSSL
jgi:2-polyprenyl-3-methyl-5-hydroxy-6-metoxy-1,4-benzoquinol methylase